MAPGPEHKTEFESACTCCLVQHLFVFHQKPEALTYQRYVQKICSQKRSRQMYTCGMKFPTTTIFSVTCGIRASTVCSVVRYGRRSCGVVLATSKIFTAGSCGITLTTSTVCSKDLRQRQIHPLQQDAVESAPVGSTCPRHQSFHDWRDGHNKDLLHNAFRNE